MGQAPGALQLILEEEKMGKKRESEGAERGKECKRIEKGREKKGMRERGGGKGRGGDGEQLC